MLWLIIVLIGLIAGLYYIYRTAVLKKGVRYFVSALIMRNNHWYEKEGRKQLVPSGQRSQEAPSTFWQEGSECTLTATDDVLLHARVFDQCAKTWVICLHGYRSSGQVDCQDAAKIWH